MPETLFKKLTIFWKSHSSAFFLTVAAFVAVGAGVFIFFMLQKPLTPVCVDSDASKGRDAIYTKGTTTFSDAFGKKTIVTDTCNDIGGKLNEWSCQGGKQVFECALGCVEGACVRPATQPVKTKPAMFSLNWSIAAQVTLFPRGATIPLIWQVSGDMPQQRIYFALLAPGVQTQTQAFSASQEKGLFPIYVPPGRYILKLVSPLLATNGLPVEVTGPKPGIYSERSYLEFNGPVQEGSGVVIADRHCSIRVSAHVNDAYGFGIIGKNVLLSTDRGGAEIIAKLSNATLQNGTMAFNVSSKKPGIAHLKAVADDITFSNTLTLKILDPSAHQCPQENPS